MMLTICGALTILIITVYLSYQASSMEQKRVRQTEGFLLLLRHIKSQISSYCAPLNEIVESFENDALESAGFIKALKEGDFNSAISATKDKIYLDTEEINLLLSFGVELGGGYRRSELENCDYYIGELENSYTRRREEQPKKARLYRSLVLTGGLMLIIVFL